MIDSHVNLHAGQFDEDRAAVIARAREAGVRTMVTICDKVVNFPEVVAIADAHGDIWASVGAHPHYAKDHRGLSAGALIELARANPRVVGIGETGLDLHYNHSPFADQVACFRAHIEAARALDLPLIVHTREADDQTADILEEEMGRGAFRLLMHCYTSGQGLAQRALKLGATISFSGILTFKNARDVRAIATETPLERVILETDCPYLAPIPHRGRRCEPFMVGDVYRFFCAERGLEMEEGAAIIADNFFRLFDAVKRPATAPA
ncbi:MAG: TatD family hydrolase [Hyphomonadaceae bacterium]|nr:TatD family hydrolase [Hyphomonadaceae bacterium]